jgi:hypothetical protein
VEDAVMHGRSARRQVEHRRAELRTSLACAYSDLPVSRVDAALAQVFRDKVSVLAVEFDREGGGGEARHQLRELVERVVIPGDDGPLKLIGNPEKMLTAAGGQKAGAAVGQDGCGGPLPSMPTALYIIAV